MKSRITIEVNYDQNRQPMLQIIQEDSQDVRDGLVADFLQSLGHTSRWLKIEFKLWDEQNQKRWWTISPITMEQLPDEMKLMTALLSGADPSMV